MPKYFAAITIGLLSTVSGFSQKPPTDSSRLVFEVDSIKPSKPGGRGGGIRAMPGGQSYVASNATVKLMISLMYQLNDHQIYGGPAWLDTDRWDVEAKADAPHTHEELHEMYRNMLADRFKLKFHWEKKEIFAYALVVDKSGSKMTLNDTPDKFEFPIQGRAFGKLQATRCSMGYFAWSFLSQTLQEPIVDKTGLDKFYDFQLEWTREIPANVTAEVRANLPPTNGPDLFTALRQQLGLRLERYKGPVDVMVIDSAEKASDN
jgi:uncharacterized protein (TIGR03435 family)